MRPKRSASSRAARRRERVHLAAERARVRERRRRFSAGLAPRRVGLEVRGLDPLRRELHAARRARRHPVEQRRTRASTVVRRPCTFAGARARLEQRFGHDPAQRPRPRPHRRPSRAGSGTATSASRGAVSSANAAPPSGTVELDVLRAAGLERGPPRRGVEVAFASAAATGVAPTTASRTVSQPVHRHRCAASARSTSRSRVPANRITIPGVQNPHCDPPVATNASRPRGPRRVASSPSIVVTARPSTRAAGCDARDARLAVDEHRATTALTLRRAPVLGRHDTEPFAQHVQQRFAALDVGVDRDRRAVEHERDRRRHRGDRTRRPRPGPDAKRPRRSGAVTESRTRRSGERLAAAAGALRVRVVDREARALQAVLVVERRARRGAARSRGRPRPGRRRRTRRCRRRPSRCRRTSRSDRPEQPPGRTATRRYSSGWPSAAISSLTLVGCGIGQGDHLGLRERRFGRANRTSGYFDGNGDPARVAVVQRRELLDASPADRATDALADPAVQVADELGVGLGQLPERAVQERDVGAAAGRASPLGVEARAGPSRRTAPSRTTSSGCGGRLRRPRTGRPPSASARVGADPLGQHREHARRAGV